MNPRALIARLNRAQRGTPFKIAATIVTAALCIGVFVTLYVLSRDARTVQAATGAAAKATDAGAWFNQGPIGALTLAFHSMIDALRESSGIASVAILWTLVAVVASTFIWLGIGLSALAGLLIGWGVAWPLMLNEHTAWVGRLLAGAIPLSLVFLAGLSLLRAAFAAPRPVFAVARTLLDEAVRMKVSLVFIVLVIFFLAVIPGLLTTDQPLRYRVQQWFQYGTGLTYAVLAFLTLFLATASVAYEQRDRIIWQTMTKPVAPWQYLLGKWVGVMGLNAVLLIVTASGVFLFTEYLRNQPARGEIARNVLENGTVTTGDPSLMTEDRRILETQVLVARVAIMPEPYQPSDSKLDLLTNIAVKARIAENSTVQDTPELRKSIRDELVETFNKRLTDSVEQLMLETKSRDPRVQDTPELRDQFAREVLSDWELQYRTIEPGVPPETYVFQGLGALRNDPNGILTLRFQINAGSNDPSALYRIVFIIRGVPHERQVALKAAQTFPISTDFINDDGSLMISVYNGPGDPSSAPQNRNAITFPPDGLELLYTAGGYELNFLRVFGVIWIKLGFIAAVAIAAASFLSFSVASLVALAFLIMAESAVFLDDSLKNYLQLTNVGGGTNIPNVIISLVATPVAAIFHTYAALNPTGKLVDGLLISWSELASALLTIGGWTLAALGLGLAIFRRRELALYSGQ